MNNLDRQYQDLVKEILLTGSTKEDRTGTGTISLFGKQIRHDMSEGFPILTTKKVNWESVVTELLWFLRGDTNIRYLLEKGCNIWNGDAYKKYVKDIKDSAERWLKLNPDILMDTEILSKENFIKKLKEDEKFSEIYGELGPIYGKQWRSWKNPTILEDGSGGYKDPIDQIAHVFNELKTNPDSRRLIVNSWNVNEIELMTLPPCHYSFQLYTSVMNNDERNSWFHKYRNANNPRGKSDWKDFELDQQNIPKRKISLMWNQRSVDVPLGLPFNIASYGLLLSIFANETNMIPDKLIGNLGDCHVYLNQVEGIQEQLKRAPYELPKLGSFRKLDDPSILLKPLYWKPEDFRLDGYQSHTAIKLPLSNG